MSEIAKNKVEIISEAAKKEVEIMGETANGVNIMIETTKSESFIEGEDNYKKVHISYFTDPLCSYCWVFEPAFKKLLLEYGDYFSFSIHMGGLIGAYEGFSEVYDDVIDPSDMKDHWEQIAATFHMPIDGSVWLEGKVISSYPSSFLYLYLKTNYPFHSDSYLREVRNTLFVGNKPIDNDNVLTEVLEKIGLQNAASIVSLSRNEDVYLLMHADLESGKNYKIQGFPTLILHNKDSVILNNNDSTTLNNNNSKVLHDKDNVSVVLNEIDSSIAKYEDILLFGARSYKYYVDGLITAYSKSLNGASFELVKKQIPPLSTLIKQQAVFYAKEIAVIYEIEIDKVIEYCKGTLTSGTYVIKEILGETAIYKV